MTLNSEAPGRSGLLDAAFRLAKGTEVSEELVAALPPELRDTAIAYAREDHAANVAPLLADIDILNDMTWYIRLESALAMLFREEIQPASFLALTARPGIPPYLIHYYRGIGAYRQGKVALALIHFSRQGQG